MITFEDAMQKAHHYLGDADIPVVITSLGRFSEGWFFAFSPESISKQEKPPHYLLETLLL
jgi:hypothetical protein